MQICRAVPIPFQGEEIASSSFKIPLCFDVQLDGHLKAQVI